MELGKVVLLVAMSAFGLAFAAVWWARRREDRAAAGAPAQATTARFVSIGFVTNFFDTLGIGPCYHDHDLPRLEGDRSPHPGH
jgi:hypothetical protein